MRDFASAALAGFAVIGRCGPDPAGAEHRSPFPEVGMRSLCHYGPGAWPPRRRGQAPRGRFRSAFGSYTSNGVTPQGRECEETGCWFLVKGPT